MCALPDGGVWPLVVFAIAAVSDYVDGPLARRAGAASSHGVLLDAGADIAFVLSGTATGAAIGVVSWLVPAAILAAAAPFLVATVRRSRVAGKPTRAFSRIGHAAGVANYALVGLIAGSIAAPDARWPWLLVPGSLAVVALNVSAVALRLRAPS